MTLRNGVACRATLNSDVPVQLSVSARGRSWRVLLKKHFARMLFLEAAALESVATRDSRRLQSCRYERWLCQGTALIVPLNDPKEERLQPLRYMFRVAARTL